jgi:regulator of protease activity HflC (stomatin/prohibitin superfamily)
MWGWLIALLVGGGAVSSVKIIQQGNEALVERLGSYDRKLSHGMNFVIPGLDRVAFQETIREKVLDIPPQPCITRDNVAITVDAVVYWRIVDMEKAYYKVENLQSAMVNMVLTQIRSEMGQLELDETLTARSQVNEILLRDLDVATDPWGIKVTRVELRDIIPSKAVQESMELQMSAERRKRAAILTSEGEREAAVNSAKGQAESQLLDAEARQKAVVLAGEAEKQRLVLQAQAERQQQVLKAQAAAEAIAVVTQALKSDPRAAEAGKILLALNYLDMGTAVGKSNSSKVMFMDPGSIPATLQGMLSLVGDSNGQK